MRLFSLFQCLRQTIEFKKLPQPPPQKNTVKGYNFVFFKYTYIQARTSIKSQY